VSRELERQRGWEGCYPSRDREGAVLISEGREPSGLPHVGAGGGEADVIGRSEWPPFMAFLPAL
jgi:hypothetical protein